MHSTPDPYRAARLLLDAYPSLLRPAAARPADAWRPLSACELRVHSQNGEDGVLAEMLSRIGPGTRSFVEFGVGAGSEGTCVFLADWCGWRGLFMESQPEAFARLGRKYGMNPDVQTFQTIVAPGTIDALLHRAGIPYDLDVLSIDVDGADYWIWSALTRAAPRVVVIEYNAALGGERRLAQHPARQTWDGTVAFGASIAALASLGRARGYSLTHTDLTGTNAFFVRDDYAALFPEIKAPRIRGPNLSLRSEGHRPSERQAVFVEVPEQRAHEEPTADGDTGVQRVVATGLGPLLFPATDRVIAACIRDTGAWQPAELDWLKTHVPRGGTCLTIGANVGYFACWMSRLVGPRGRVFAVEPNPRLVPLLRANLAECALPNVDVAPCAAGAADGTATLWISDANSGDSRVFDPRLVATDDDHDATGCGDWLHSVDVPMRAADGIVGDRAVDVVFIDAQGWDHHALRGLRSTIDRCRPVILFEFVPAWIRGLGEDPATVLAECASWGYRLGSSDVAVEHPAAPDVILAAMAAAGQAFVNIEMLPGDPVPTSGRGA